MDQLATTARIALVDADNARRNRLRSFLDPQWTAVDVDSALPDDVDVIVIEAGHPRLSVTNVVAELRARDADIPVLVIAADAAVGGAALRAGAYDVIGEPLERDRAEAALRRALERRELTRKLRALQRQLAQKVDGNGDGEGVIPLRELERRAIEKALAASRGSVEKAARMLGMGRATLYRRLATMAASRVV